MIWRSRVPLNTICNFCLEAKESQFMMCCFILINPSGFGRIIPTIPTYDFSSLFYDFECSQREMTCRSKNDETNKIICIQLSNEKSGLKFICILVKRKIPVSPQLKHLTPSSITIKSVTLIDMTKHVHLPWSLNEYRILYIGLNSNDIHLFKSCRAEIIEIEILAIFYKTYGKYSKT